MIAGMDLPKEILDGGKLIRRTSLHCNKGTSDKVYHIAIVQDGDEMYCLWTAYGRRLGNMKTERKDMASSLWLLSNKFHSIIGEKHKKGYNIITSDTTLADEECTTFEAKWNNTLTCKFNFYSNGNCAVKVKNSNDYYIETPIEKITQEKKILNKEGEEIDCSDDFVEFIVESVENFCETT